MKHIVSFSGGKDSTAMLLMMIEKKMQIDEIIFADTGCEFPDMIKHVDDVERYIDMPITRIKAEHSFEYYLSKHKKKSGKYMHVDGLGWPGFRFRWCTGNLKTKVIDRHIKEQGEHCMYIGIALDESKRLERSYYKNKMNWKFPLIEWEVTEEQALHYCYNKGFDWSELYVNFDRVSCYLCPLQKIGALRTLYNKYPDLWNEMMRLDRLSYRSFTTRKTLAELDIRFEMEAKK